MGINSNTFFCRTRDKQLCALSLMPMSPKELPCPAAFLSEFPIVGANSREAKGVCTAFISNHRPRGREIPRDEMHYRKETHAPKHSRVVRRFAVFNLLITSATT